MKYEGEQQLWIDLLTGMRNRAAQIVNDPSDDIGRNDNWYAREVYGQKYEVIREEFQDRELDRLDLDRNV